MPGNRYALILLLVVLAAAYGIGRLVGQWRPLLLIEGHWQGQAVQSEGGRLLTMRYQLYSHGRQVDVSERFYGPRQQLLGQRQLTLHFLGKTPDTERNIFERANPPADAGLRVDTSLRMPLLLYIDHDHYFVVRRFSEGYLGMMFTHANKST